MLEAIRNSRMGIRTLFVLAAMMVVLMGASVMFNAPTDSLGGSLGTKEADASHQDYWEWDRGGGFWWYFTPDSSYSMGYMYVNPGWTYQQQLAKIGYAANECRWAGGHLDPYDAYYHVCIHNWA